MNGIINKRDPIIPLHPRYQNQQGGMRSFWVTDVRHLNLVCYANAKSLSVSRSGKALFSFFFRSSNPEETGKQINFDEIQITGLSSGKYLSSSMFSGIVLKG